VTGVEEERDGSPCADLLTRRAGVDAAAAADELLSELPGWLAATVDEDLAEALLARGGELVRHADVMRKDLAHSPPPPTTALAFELLPFHLDASPPRPWTAALPGFLAAYPPEHPDHLPGGEDLIDSYLVEYTQRGRLGPLITQASGFAVDGERVCGGLLIVDRADEGPWISDVWRDPDYRCAGAGSALITQAAPILRALGYDALGLAVTCSNRPAVRAYTRLGFIRTSTAWTIRLPSG